LPMIVAIFLVATFSFAYWLT